MKIRNYLLMALIGTGLLGCYDDSGLWDKVNSLDDRVTILESQLSEMNKEIQGISVIINAIQNNVYIVSVVQIKDGYEIVFTDGTKTVIKNGNDGLTPYIGEDGNWWIGDTNTGIPAAGKDGEDGKDGVDGEDGKDGEDGVDGLTPYVGEDGNWWIGDINTGIPAAGKDGNDGKDAPVISVALYEGVYYWVQIYNGVQSWLLDEDGNKIPVSGTDGTTPILRVDANGYWIISYDHGITFIRVLDEYGRPVKASGNDGDSMFDSVIFDSVNGVLIVVINGETIRIPVETPTGIPSDSSAGNPPYFSDAEITFNMPTGISPISRDPSNSRIGTFNLAGMYQNGKWLELYGTGDSRQNVWLEIEGVQKGVIIINGEATVTKAKADVVFLVDNSGSMSEEANKVASEIIRWSQELSQTMDVQFGCVGIDHCDVNGALNITDVNTLSDYLNAHGSGTSRTAHYGENMSTPPADMAALKSAAADYDNAGGECGGIMLHFADENFTFRDGANRFYVYFTDEPNQPGGVAAWSVKTVDQTSEYYNWNASKGVIYTVYSNTDNPENYTNWLNNENPLLFSTYTGGQTLKTTGNFDISLSDLPVTGAITQSFIFKFNITGDLLPNGRYDVTITIYYPDGSVKSRYTYKDILFVA